MALTRHFSIAMLVYKRVRVFFFAQFAYSERVPAADPAEAFAGSPAKDLFVPPASARGS
jgi:hypothetical protein